MVLEPSGILRLASKTSIRCGGVVNEDEVSHAAQIVANMGRRNSVPLYFYTEVFWLKVQLSGPAFRRGMALIAYQTRLSLLGSPATGFLRAFILF